MGRQLPNLQLNLEDFFMPLHVFDYTHQPNSYRNTQIYDILQPTQSQTTLVLVCEIFIAYCEVQYGIQLKINQFFDMNHTTI